jgi:signal transduction histidine kinase
VVRETVLVVEDDVALLQMVIDTLMREGYVVTGVSRSHDAIGIIADNNTDLLVTDITLPDAKGIELVNRAHLFDPEIGTVVIVQDCSSDAIIEIAKSGVQSVLTMPFSPEQLVSACTEAIEKARALKEYIRLKALMPLFEVSKSLISELRSDKLYDYVVRIISAETRADVVSLMLLDEISGGLVLVAGVGIPPKAIGREINRAVENAPYKAVETGTSIVVRNTSGTQAKAYAGSASILAFPLISRGRVIGALKASKAASKMPFTEYDIELLTILAGQAATAIENAKLFDKIAVEKGRLARLVKKVFKAQEDERSRISEQLHDTVAQWMVSASYRSQSSKVLIAQSRFDEAISEIDRVKGITEQCVHEIRRVMLDLRPHLLNELGLVDALQRHLESLGQEKDIKCYFTVDGKPSALPWTHEVAIYRVALEAISNIRKHANASEVSLRLQFYPGIIQAMVTDNGSGFDFKKAMENGNRAGSMGLMSMHERAETVGGDLKIESARGLGTKIVLAIPTGKKRNTRNPNSLVSCSTATKGGDT